MFDLDVSKMLIVGLVALLVVGPKDLPRVLRTVGQVIGKMRRMAAEIQTQILDAAKEADLEGVKKEFGAIRDSANLDISLDPATAMRGHPTPVEGSNSRTAEPADLAASTEATYSSPEMREYLALSPDSPVGASVALADADDVAKKEIANENSEPADVPDDERDGAVRHVASARPN
jgi:sec-independent protein translocase protein TatB